MTYPQTIDFLYSCLPVFHRIGKMAYKEGLGNTLILDEYFDHPHRRFRSIHVAGTNGKGSVAHMLAAILQRAGFKTGLYTSPHLVDFRERIRINGEMMPQEEVVRFVEKHRAIIDRIHPSFFEMSVAMAYDFFAQQQVDIAVIEVGLGGRLDSTNIIHPMASVITNISYDHMDLLGDTLPKIAGEKAGIIKPGVPVVIGEEQEEVRDVFVHKAAEENSELVFASRLYHTNERHTNGNGTQKLLITGPDKNQFTVESDLLGIYQQKNIPTVLAVTDILKKEGLPLTREGILGAIRETVKLTGLHGRWQIINRSPLLVCDTGHNQAGIREVVNQIEQTPHRRLHFIFGMVKDKPSSLVLPLLPTEALYYFTRANIPRAMDENVLEEQAREADLKGACFPDVPSAVQAALAKASPEDMIFVGGSSFVVADYLKSLK